MSEFTWNDAMLAGDERGSVTRSVHLPSGASRIDVTYSYADGDGLPAVPGRRTQAGEGQLSAMQIGDGYRLLSYRFAPTEGAEPVNDVGADGDADDEAPAGTTEDAGTDGAAGPAETGASEEAPAATQSPGYVIEDGAFVYADPVYGDLSGLESDMEARKGLIDEAFAAANADEYDADALAGLVSRWEGITRHGVPRELDYDVNWERAVRANKRVGDRNVAAERKAALLAEAKELSTSTEWGRTSGRMRKMMEEWKAAGSAGHERDQSLWAEFREAREAFYSARESAWGEAQAKKQALIAEAMDVAGKAPDNWGDASRRMRELMDEWKAAGSTGREEERLWKEFSEVRKGFYDARAKADDRRKSELASRTERKRAIIAEARTYASDYSKVAMDRMKAMTREWKQVGGTGRDEDRLWKEFRKVQDGYWEGLRQARHERQSEWTRKFELAVSRKQEKADKLRKGIDDLRSRMEHAEGDQRDHIGEWLDEDERRLAELERQIDDVKKKMGVKEETPGDAEPGTSDATADATPAEPAADGTAGADPIAPGTPGIGEAAPAEADVPEAQATPDSAE